MSLAEHNSVHFEYRYSPPVSPKSIPHGFKRKASTQEDELDGFKKLRLQESNQPILRKVKPHSTHGKKTRSFDAGVPRLEVQDIDLLGPPLQQSVPETSIHTHNAYDDLMLADDTSDRVWIHDLDREIAEIEAEEERARTTFLSETADAYSKIPEHLLKQNSHDDPANMQLILYQDPTSISVPEEEDAVRKTIIDARRRMREAQGQVDDSTITTNTRMRRIETVEDENDMDMDLD